MSIRKIRPEVFLSQFSSMRPKDHLFHRGQIDLISLNNINSSFKNQFEMRFVLRNPLSIKNFILYNGLTSLSHSGLVLHKLFSTSITKKIN